MTDFQAMTTRPFSDTGLPRAVRAGTGAIAFVLAFSAASCASDSPAEQEPAVVMIDQAFTEASLWDDGQAEISFYEVERRRNQYGRPDSQRFMVGTYLVKHDFSQETMSKALEPNEGLPAFKYALFYEVESGSYQYKRSWVVNAARADFRPLKQSFASFDWCSNQYREMAFHPDGRIVTLFRSDDYGNSTGAFEGRRAAFPPVEIPLLIRGLDMKERERYTFLVVLEDGQYVEATAEKAGVERIEWPGGSADAEQIIVRYALPIPSMIGEESAPVEVYWLDTGPERLLLKMAAQDGQYQMTLVETLRSPYWEEDIFPLLQRVQERP